MAIRTKLQYDLLMVSCHYQTFLSSKGNFNHENVLHTGIHF